MQAMAGMLVIGDPGDPRTVVGPLIRAVARERVERFIERVAGTFRARHWASAPTRTTT